jgi:2-oxoglutarate ferredoxin oxidoreductase subunit beta
MLRMDRLPHIWCPGCGNGIIAQAFVRAVDGLGFDRDSMAVVSGIGCSGRAAGYVKMDSFHTTHGRAIPFAVGLKAARPELNVTVFSGDGDNGSDLTRPANPLRHRWCRAVQEGHRARAGRA